MNLAPQSIAWTIRAALVVYFAYLMLRILVPDRRKVWPAERALWTLGCGVFLVHVLCAFAFAYRWSLAYAYEQTAMQTEAVVGLRFGGGVYFNYAFTLLWIADVAWAWLAAESYLRRAKWIDGALHGFFLLMAFNGAIVFHNGVSRWGGIVGFAALAALGLWAASRRMKHKVSRPMADGG